MADKLAEPGFRIRARDVVRYVLGILLGVVVLLLLFGKRGELVAAWHQLGHVSVGWVAAGVLAESLSLLAYACLQHRILHLSGTRLPMPALMGLTLANDAISNSMPAEPAISTTYRYRYYRRRGATAASAGWSIFTTLISQALGMSLLLLVGVLVALAGSTSARDIGATVAGLVIVLTAGAILVRRDLVLRLIEGVVRLMQRVTGHPRGNVAARLEATLARMREIPLSRASAVGVVGIAFCVWFADFLCLICSLGAVGAAIPWYGVLLAYGVAQVVGTIPIIPGGVGIIEGSMAVILVAYGASRVSALSAVLVYRIISFWLGLVVGWLSFAVITHQGRRRRRSADDTPDPGLQAIGAMPPD